MDAIANALSRVHCMTSETPNNEPPPVRCREITPAFEFMAWVMVALAPLLRLANGPPVTTDQWYFQIIVASLSLFTAIGLRVYNWLVPPVKK